MLRVNGTERTLSSSVHPSAGDDLGLFFQVLDPSLPVRTGAVVRCDSDAQFDFKCGWFELEFN